MSTELEVAAGPVPKTSTALTSNVYTVSGSPPNDSVLADDDVSIGVWATPLANGVTTYPVAYIGATGACQLSVTAVPATVAVASIGAGSGSASAIPSVSSKPVEAPEMS